MSCVLLWKFNYGQVHVINIGAVGTPGSYELLDVVDKALVPCLDFCNENSFYLLSTLATVYTHLQLVMFQVCFIS